MKKILGLISIIVFITVAVGSIYAWGKPTAQELNALNFPVGVYAGENSRLYVEVDTSLIPEKGIVRHSYKRTDTWQTSGGFVKYGIYKIISPQKVAFYIGHNYCTLEYNDKMIFVSPNVGEVILEKKIGGKH